MVIGLFVAAGAVGKQDVRGPSAARTSKTSGLSASRSTAQLIDALAAPAKLSDAYAELKARGHTAIAEIRAALKDQRNLVRYNCAELVWQIDGDAEAALPVIVEAATDTRTNCQVWSCGILASMGKRAESAVPTLTALVTSANDSGRTTQPDLVMAIVKALGAIGPAAQQAAVEVERLRGHRDLPNAAVVVDETLASIGPLDAKPLAASFASDTADVRAAAARLLGRCRASASEVVPLLAEAVYGDREWIVRVSAAEGLESFGPDAAGAVPVLVRALANLNGDEGYPAGGLDNSRVREAAVAVTRALGRIGPAAVGAVIEIERFRYDRNTDDSERRIAEEAAGRIGPASIKALVHGLAAPSAASRSAAARLLGSTGTEAAGSSAALAEVVFSDTDNAVRAEAAQALSRMGPAASDGTSLLVRTLANLNGDQGYPAGGLDNANVRNLAVLLAATLGAIGPDAASGAVQLERLRADRNLSDAERRAVESAAARIGPVPLPLLIEGLAQQSPASRAAAARLLGAATSGAEQAVPALAKTVADDSDMEPRLDAVRALGRIGAGARQAAPVLSKVLACLNGDCKYPSGGLDDSLVRHLAVVVVETLGLIGPDSAVAIPQIRRFHDDRSVDDKDRRAAELALERVGVP